MINRRYEYSKAAISDPRSYGTGFRLKWRKVSYIINFNKIILFIFTKNYYLAIYK